VSDELWLSAVALAKERGESLSEVIREALRRYVKRGK
jgi:metal-responsive CopG/Arc/MetJ family transcriptional regulator